MTWGTALVLLLIGVMVFFAIRSTFGLGRKKRSGGSRGCGGGCGSCPYSGKCHH